MRERVSRFGKFIFLSLVQAGRIGKKPGNSSGNGIVSNRGLPGLASLFHTFRRPWIQLKCIDSKHYFSRIKSQFVKNDRFK